MTRIATSEKLGDTNQKARDFFALASDNFSSAQTATERVDRFYTIGGCTVCLNFAGPALVDRMTPAFEHLATEPVIDPDLIVGLWDSASTHTIMPPPPWTTHDYIGRGEIRGYNDERMHTAFHLGANALSMLDLAQDRALYWVSDATQVPYYESGSPLRFILHWWMPSRGLRFVHSGAVGQANGGVLLAGKGGTGKSTTTLACLEQGFLYAGDDYVLVSINEDPWVFSLYNTAKLEADHIQKLPFLLPAISNRHRLESEKALVFVHPHFPEQTTSGFPLRAILVPQITGSPQTRLRPASPAIGLRALATSTIFQLPGAGQRDLDALSQFVGGLPTYVLELGTDIAAIPQVLADFLSGGYKGHAIAG